MYSKPPQYPENPFWAHKAACPATVFFFPRLAGQDRLDYSVLVLLLFGYLAGHIYGAYHTEFLLENKDGFQVVLSERMKYHVAVLPQIIRQCSSPLPAHGL